LKYAFLGADEILMAKLFMLIILLLGTVLLFGSLGGCMNSGSNPDDENLIQVRDRVLTVLEFNQAFEIAKTAYPHNLRFDRDDFKTAQLRLLNQLMVEMIILERAEELGLDISDEDVEQAVAEIKNQSMTELFDKIAKTAT
jgi:parvulin-like peptidyl-prolyl isomerase